MARDHVCCVHASVLVGVCMWPGGRPGQVRVCTCVCPYACTCVHTCAHISRPFLVIPWCPHAETPPSSYQGLTLLSRQGHLSGAFPPSTLNALDEAALQALGLCRLSDSVDGVRESSKDPN